MAGFAKKFESAKQDWATPDDLFNPINNEFRFTLDAGQKSHKDHTDFARSIGFLI